jgi:hypothetical protein
MSIIYVDLDADYTPKTEDQDINIDVQIGDGQSGAYVIFLGQELKGTNKAANLGIKSNVTGKITTVAVTIIDKLKETNWTSMTVIITEGKDQTSFGPYKKQAPEHLDTVIYTLKIVYP